MRGLREIEAGYSVLIFKDIEVPGLFYQFKVGLVEEEEVFFAVHLFCERDVLYVQGMRRSLRRISQCCWQEPRCLL